MARVATPYQESSRFIDYTAGSDIAVGDVVVLGKFLCGVAVANIANGAVGVIDTEGLCKVDAVNNLAFAVGDVLYWNASTKKCTNVEAGLPILGVAVAAKLQTGTYAYVALNRQNAHGLPVGGSDNHILKKTGAGDWTYAWEADAVA